MMYNVKLRKNSKSDHENQLIKNNCNHLYGKFYPQTTKLSIKFCTSMQKSMKFTSQTDFHDVLLLNSNLSMFTFKQKKVLYDKNLLISFVILQNSLTTFYKHIYHLKAFFGPRFSILGAEIDSITAKYIDVNRDYVAKLSSLCHLFDFSNLSPKNALYSKVNENQIGIFKIEFEYPTEWIKLRSKVWCVKQLCKTCKMPCNEISSDTCTKCSGGIISVSKGCTENVPFSTYIKALNNEKEVYSEYYTVSARNERIRLLKRKAKALTSYDWKRIWITPTLSKPYGHDG